MTPTLVSRNPARLDDVVWAGPTADAGAFAAACRAARDAQPALGGHSRSGPRPRDPADRPHRRAQQGGARATGDARDRQAVRRVARRGAGDRRHLRLLPGRGPASLRPDGAERDARQAAVHVPRARRRGRDPHRGELPGRRAGLVPGPGAAVRQRGRVEAGRVLPGLRRGAWANCSRHGGLPEGVLNVVQAEGPAAGEGLERALGEGLVDKVGFTGSSEVGPADRRAVRPPPAVAVPRARRQEPARRHGRRGPRPRGRGCAVQRLRHRRAALHVAGDRDRPRDGARRVPRAAGAALSRPRRSATRRRTCSTAR